MTRSAVPFTLLALLSACPKPPPEPVPADECKKPGQQCAEPPAPEGPPPVGSQAPGPETR